jgi:hypothetical protein
MISQASGSFPSGDYPPFPGAVRLAKAADLSRMADVSVLGFKDSEIFRFERPHYHEFPEDAVASFACIYRAHLLDPRMVVVVVEDVRRPDELTSLPAAGEKEYGTTTPENVVVGVASWAFPEGSKRQGNFIVPDVGRLDPSPDRDLSHRRLELFNRITEETQAK